MTVRWMLLATLLATLLAQACGTVAANGGTSTPTSPAATPQPSSPDASPERSAPSHDEHEPIADVPAASDLVDLSLPTPHSGGVLGESDDGHVLVWVTGMASMTTPFGPGMGTYTYWMVLDPACRCVLETHRADQLRAVAATGTEEEALELLRQDATFEELDRLATLAARFGVHSLGGVRFGEVALVDANDRFYEIHARRVRPLGRNFRPGRAVSVSGVWRARGERRRLVVERIGASTRRRLPLQSVRELYWAPDDTLFFSYDDGDGIRRESTELCIGRYRPPARRHTELHCVPNRMLSAASSLASPSARFAALQAVGEARGSQTIQIVELPAGTLRNTITGDFTYADLDDDGRFVFSEIDYDAGEYLIRLSDLDGAEHRHPGYDSFGFLQDGSVLARRSIQIPPPDHEVTLEDGWCDLFERWSPNTESQ